MSFSLTKRRIRREGERGKYVKVFFEILFCECNLNCTVSIPKKNRFRGANVGDLAHSVIIFGRF